jgi:hypothetical protein
MNNIDCDAFKCAICLKVVPNTVTVAFKNQTNEDEDSKKVEALAYKYLVHPECFDRLLQIHAECSLCQRKIEELPNSNKLFTKEKKEHEFLSQEEQELSEDLIQKQQELNEDLKTIVKTCKLFISIIYFNYFT